MAPIKKKQNVIIDSDIGDDITDVCALMFALCIKEFNIKAIISNNGHEGQRAQIIQKIVDGYGMHVPVYSGIKGGKGRLKNQLEYIRGYDKKPKNLQDEISYFKRILKHKTIYISLGSLTNMAYILKTFPGCHGALETFIMGGSIERDYHGRKNQAREWNMYCDIEAAKYVFNSKMKIKLIPLDAAWNIELSKEQVKILRKNKTFEFFYKIWKRSHKRQPIQYDSLAIAAVVKPELLRYKRYRLRVDDAGRTIKSDQGKEIKTAVSSDKKKFQKYFIRTILG